jgi:hypothetical protein
VAVVVREGQTIFLEFGVSITPLVEGIGDRGLEPQGAFAALECLPVQTSHRHRGDNPLKGLICFHFSCIMEVPSVRL